MAQLDRSALATDISSNVYTNTQRKIKGNTVRDRLLNLSESSLNILTDADVAGGYLAISPTGLVDITFIKSATPTGQFLKDDGTWGTPAGGGGGSTSSTLADVLGNGNSTSNLPIISDNFSASLGVYNTQIGMIWSGSIGAGSVVVDDNKVEILHDFLININAPSVKKNGVEIATIDDISTSITSALTAYQPLSQKGANNGYASLDSGGKVPASQLPSTLMTLQGSWNASTNSPFLANGDGDIGDVYECTVAGTVNFGAGNITFKVGDWCVYGADNKWYKSLNSNEVTSVNSQTGTVVLTTSHISEGTNLYWTSARFDTAFAAKSTTNLSEGTNLYYTAARFNTAFAAKSTSDLSEGSNLYFTDARAQAAAVANNLTASTTVAPSKTAVNAALALKANIQDGPASTVTISVLTIDGTGTNNDVRVAPTSWYISSVLYSTSSNTDFLNIALAASGLQRYVGFYGDNTNTITKVEGTEAAIAAVPATPSGKVLLGYVLVTDSAAATTPDLSGYMLKSDKATPADVVSGTDNVKYMTAYSTAGTLLKVVPRKTTITSSATPAINTDNCTVVSITALATNITSMSSGLTGTPGDFQRLIIRILDNGTPRTITWGASFVAGGATLPTTTTASKVWNISFQYDSVKAKWVCLSAVQEP